MSQPAPLPWLTLFPFLDVPDFGCSLVDGLRKRLGL